MPWMENLQERYLELVNTFVNTPEVTTAIIDDTSEYSYSKNGGAYGIRTPDPLLAKHRPATNLNGRILYLCLKIAANRSIQTKMHLVICLSTPSF